MQIKTVVNFMSGSAQFRIKESTDPNAPVYFFYSQMNVAEDLSGLSTSDIDNKLVRTFDDVNTVKEGDVIFSLISGTAAMVQRASENRLITQNYVKLVPKKKIFPQYLVYILNEGKSIRQQFTQSLQGSSVIKYTLSQLKSLELPALPSINKQKLIGDLYFMQLRLQVLRKRVADSETALLLKRIEEINQDE